MLLQVLFPGSLEAATRKGACKEKSYNCNECEKSFSQKKNLTRHQAFHGKTQDPLECPAKDKGCSYTNLRKDKMAHHISAKHPELLKKDEASKDAFALNAVKNCFDKIDETTREDMLRTVDICLDSFKDQETNESKVDSINHKNNEDNDLNPSGKNEQNNETSSGTLLFPPNQSGICLDPIKYVNPPNQTVTQSLATYPTTTPPLDMASTIASISSSFLQGFM